jgi:hypothetical protein
MDSTSNSPDQIATAMIDVAQDLVAALSSDQRDSALWPFPSDEERRQWFYTPTDHGGLPLADMTSSQHRLVQRLLASVLSPRGYNTAALIQGQENVLDHLEGFRVDFGRERGRDPLLYWIAFFGTPDTEGPWGWRFGGHHLSLSITVIDGRVASTSPFFLGADPASAPLLGPHVHRPLGGLEDLGRELARSLSHDQAGQAILAPVPPLDLVTSNRTTLSEGDLPLPLNAIWRSRFEGELDRLMTEMDQNGAESIGLESAHVEAVRFTMAPKGIAAATLQPGQKEILRSLLESYVAMIHDDFADREAEKFVGERLDQMHFVWAGGLESGQPHYFRIQGGDLLAEYDCAQRNGNHVHTVWRDLSNDFGGDSLAAHYTDDHSHHG